MFKLDMQKNGIRVSSDHNKISKDKLKKEIVLAINLITLHYKLMIKEKDSDEYDHLELMKEIKDLPVESFRRMIKCENNNLMKGGFDDEQDEK